MFYTDLGHKIYPGNFQDYEIGMENYYEIENSSIDTLTNADTIRQHIKTFTGEYNDWEHIKLHLLFFYSSKTQDEADTLNLKFHFISDSTSNERNGWAIKNIFSGEVAYWGGLNDNQLNSELIGYPTPTLSNYTVEIQNEKNQNVMIENLNGKVVKRLIKKGERIELDLSALQKGNYIIKYYLSDKYKGYSKVIKQ